MLKSQVLRIFAVLLLLASPFALAKTEKKVETAQMTLSYSDSGKSNGPVIIFIHAFPLNKSMWDNQFHYFKKDSRVLALDIRGLGESRWNQAYTLEFVVDDVIELMDKLKIEKAVVAGLSMGGFVALRLAERNPERVSALILANTKSEPDADSSRLGRYSALKAIQTKGLREFNMEFIKKAIASKDSKSFEVAKSIADKNTAEGVSLAVLALTSRTDTTASLEKIAIPTLILHGELDAVVPTTAAKSMHEKIKGSKLVIFPKVGHLSNLESPEAFNSEISKFLVESKLTTK